MTTTLIEKPKEIDDKKSDHEQVEYMRLRQATKQETFDHVAEHMLLQRRRSIDKFGNNVLRTQEGFRCPLGSLINRYHRFFEGFNAKGLISHFPFLFFEDRYDKKGEKYLFRWYIEDAEFLDQLRYIHDHKSPNEWKNQLKRLADREMLSWRFGKVEKPKSPASWYDIEFADDEDEDYPG